MEETLFILKPEVLEESLEDSILSILKSYESSGMKIIKQDLFSNCEDKWIEHYEEHKNKDFYDALITRMSRGPILVGIMRGPNCVKFLREKIGATDPTKAEKGTIREKYGTSVQRNIIHASESVEAAQREINIWFPK